MLKHKIKFRSNGIGLGQGFVYLSEIAFVFLPISVNLCFGCSGEPSHWDRSFEHPQYRFVCLFVCFTSQVNSYGHCGTVSSPNHTFFLGKLEQAVNQ